jgi:hypothetical protein
METISEKCPVCGGFGTLTTPDRQGVQTTVKCPDCKGTGFFDTPDPPAAAASGSGADRIAAERRRQMEKEGWDACHDSQHQYGELLRAAEVYIKVARLGYVYANFHHDWPWEVSWFKPGATIDEERCLEKAGALIAAELDRRKDERLLNPKFSGA